MNIIEVTNKSPKPQSNESDLSIGGHHDLVGGFAKSMVLFAFDDGILHFDMNIMSKTCTNAHQIVYKRGDVIIIHKDGISDIVFKHGILAKDVKEFIMSGVLRQVNIDADTLVHPAAIPLTSDESSQHSSSSDD